ncbi:MAG TPA: hypothetical protein VHL79_02385 [Ramlibacter sp.]|jgi:Rho-binding antiterminator|nr:hypothetical protein [Ramlibacter sp.]
MPSAYEPISCDFHDVLESFATARASVRILYRDAHGLPQELTTTIQDVYSQAGAEYLVTSGQQRLRLDQLLQVQAAHASRSST